MFNKSSVHPLEKVALAKILQTSPNPPKKNPKALNPNAKGNVENLNPEPHDP